MTSLLYLMRRMRRLFRQFAGRDVWYGAQVSCPKALFGVGAGAWCFCPEDINANAVVYSFGVGEDISFERELIQRFEARVHAFDPTPRSLRWLKSQALPKGFFFHDY